MSNLINIEIWSDIVCPFCYIGKRKFEAALAEFPEKEQVVITWKSFQLDSNIPENLKPETDIYRYLADNKGISLEQSREMHANVTAMAAQVGLEYNFEQAKVYNTLRAHRVLQYAKSKSLGNEMKELLLEAHFTLGKNNAEQETLIELGVRAGLNEEEVLKALNEDEWHARVVSDIQESRQIGVRGVPFFVFNRTFAVSGAQPIEVFQQALQKSLEGLKDEKDQNSKSNSDGNECQSDQYC